MSNRIIVLSAIAVAFLSGPAWGQGDKKKFLDKTQAEWLKVLEEHKEKRFRRAAVIVLKVEFPKTQETMTAFARALANDAAPEVRQEIAASLGDIGKEGAVMVDALAQRLEQDENARVREAAARSLGRLAEYATTHVERLGKALKDPDPGTRSAAAEALIFFGDKAKKVLPLVTDAAGDPKLDVFTRIYAVRILAKQSGKDEKTAKVLGGILAEKTASLNLRQTVVTALDSMGPAASPAVPVLAQTLENTQRDEKEDKEQFQELRRTAGVALGKVGPTATAALPAVLKVLNDPDIALRSQAVRLTGMLGKNNAEAAQQLLTLLKEEKNAEVLVAAIQETAELGIQSAEQQLTALARDSRAGVRDAAALALKKLKGEK